MSRPSFGAGSLFVLLGLTGCGTAGLGDARPAPVDIPGEGTTFVYRDLGVQRVPRPARYSAPLPAPGAAWTPADPPPGWVADALCAGDPSVQAAFDASLRPTLIGRPPGDEVLDAAARFGDCASPAFCAWATSRQADPDPAVRAVYALGLVGCADAGPTLGAEGSFGPALVAWSGAELAAGRPVAWTPRLAAAVGETAAWGPGDAAQAAHIARLVDEPQAAPVLLSVAAALPAERRADFVRGLADASLPELVALSCGAPGCEPDEPPEGPAFPPAPADPADRPGWLTSLATCARSPDDDVVAAACLSVLAGADRPAAVALAGALRPDPGSPLAEPVATLIRYPAAGGMWQRLVAVGLVTGLLAVVLVQ